LLTTAIALGLAILGSRDARATVPGDLCTGNPCTVNGNKTVDSGSDLDFGPAALVLGGTAVVTVAPASPQSTMTLRAASITLQAGAKILAEGGVVKLISTVGAVTLNSAGLTRSIIDVGANSAGEIDIQAATNAVIGGRLLADGNGEDSEGGFISITAGQLVSNTELIDASSIGVFSFGGEIDITGGTGVTVNGPIDLHGGGSDGGFLEITATTGDVLLNALINANGGDPDGEGGPMEIQAPAGNIISTVPGELRGRGGAGIDEDCGDGAEVDLTAGQSITVGGPIDSKGGLQCFGGDISITAGGNFTQLATGPINTFGPGGFGGGGFFTAQIAGNATFVDVAADSTGFGGVVDIVVLGAATFNGDLTAASTALPDSIGGSISVQACNLTVSPTGDIDARGNFNFPGFGLIQLKSGGPSAIQGRVRASDRVELRYKVILPVVTGTVVPNPLIIQDPTLPDCATLPFCGDSTINGSEACDDGNNVSCDGCRSDCTREDDVCGDSIPECGEQCDDGNTDNGDGCESDCKFPGQEGVRLPGVKRDIAGCLAEWDVKISNPELKTGGFPKVKQRCIDGDPRCDADKVKDGDCEVAVQVCARVDDPRIPSCTAGPIASLSLLFPKPGALESFNQQNAITLRDALLSLGGTVKVGLNNIQTGPPIEGFDTCTDEFRVKSPTHPDTDRPNFRRVRIGALDTEGRQMGYNAFKLLCIRNNAVCGNGIVEISESCEDGNTTSCDGCSSQCQVESCGNGVVECNEQCDNGSANGTPGNSCTATCTEFVPDLRIPGGGPRSKDCAWQWSMQIDPAKVAVGLNGTPRNKQACTDNDPTCDSDPTTGVCHMRVWGCVGEENTALACSASSVPSAVALAPRASSRFPNEQAARAALSQAIANLGLPKGPSTPGQNCRSFEVDVPVSKRLLRLKVESIFPSGTKDTDVLKLRCAPGA